MENKVFGWVIYNPKHPGNGREMWFPESFRRTRNEAIKDFIKGSGNTWNYWKVKMNFKCKKAESIIKLLPDGG